MITTLRTIRTKISRYKKLGMKLGGGSVTGSEICECTVCSQYKYIIVTIVFTGTSYVIRDNCRNHVNVGDRLI